MALFNVQGRQQAGYLLVLLQFALLGGLGWLALGGRVGAAGWLLLVLSAGLGGWTLLHNRLGNFNVHPEPKADGVLVTSGPYRWMRHPMYSTVLLAAAALATVPANWLAGLLWLALLVTLLLKAKLEERWLLEKFPEYAQYSRRCKRFFPGIF
jgi:protein-S-isoprenylcysteine O-methyltransferase Ste14